MILDIQMRLWDIENDIGGFGERSPPRKKLRFHKVHFEFLSMNPSVKYICCVGKISP